MWLKKRGRQRDKNIRWMRSNVLASVEVMEFHTTEAYCNLGLANEQYNTRKLCREENEKFTVLTNPNNLSVWEHIWSTWWWKCCLEPISTPRSLILSVRVIVDSHNLQSKLRNLIQKPEWVYIPQLCNLGKEFHERIGSPLLDTRF